MKNLLILVIAGALISACTGDDKTIIKAKETEETKRSPTQTTSFADPQIQALKKSQEVQKTLDEANEKRKKEMEQQGI